MSPASGGGEGGDVWRLAARAVLLAAALAQTPGCGGSGSSGGGADVQPGGGEYAQWSQSGRIHVWGNVLNIGEADAEGVVLTFVFEYGGLEYFRQDVDFGIVRAGERRNFDLWFDGPPIPDVSRVTWGYSIWWDGA